MLRLDQSLWLGRAVRVIGLVAVVLFFVGGHIGKPSWVVAAPFLIGTALSLKILVMLSLGAAYEGPGEPTWREDEPRTFYGLLAFNALLAVLVFAGGAYLMLRAV